MTSLLKRMMLGLLRFTVVPEASERVNPSPAGTVKLLMLTVVHFSAADTSERELIVAVHGVVAASTPRAMPADTSRKEESI